MHIHILGICGTFMGGLARLAAARGDRVTGADAGVYPPMSEQLAAAGIEPVEGWDPSQLDPPPDLVVIGNALSRGNPAVEAVLDRGLPYTSGPAWLREHVLRGRHVLAVAGTHGKTTTTSLIASVLAEGGLDPTYVIGGQLNRSASNARLGTGDYLVAEADESDASFLYLQPVMAVVTNIDADHLPTYEGDFARLTETFTEFLHHLPFYGLAVVCADDANVRALMETLARPMLTYGIEAEADVVARGVKSDGPRMHFDVRLPDGDTLDGITLNLPGRHNVANALAAIAVAWELGVEPDAMRAALAGFEGIGRRLQQLGELPAGDGAALLVDDYGHHPTEIAATFGAVRASWPGRRLVVAFQPHRYTRTRDLFDDFAHALSEADALLVAEVYAAGEARIAGADARALCRAIRARGRLDPVLVPRVEELAEALANVLQPDDVVLTLGAGSIGTVARGLVERLGGQKT